MKKSIKLLTAGLLLTLCAGFAACGGGNSSGSSSSPSGSTSTSTSTSSSTPELTELSAPQNFEFYSEDNGKLMGLGYILEWEEVENATGYELRVNGQTLSSEEASFDLIHQVTVGQESEIWIKAKGNGTTYADSEEVKYTVTPKRADYGFSYEYDSELGGYLVSRGESMKTDIAFADRTHGNPIIGVAEDGFSKEETGVDVTSVSFSPGIKYIFGFAFSGTSMNSVTIPGTVEILYGCEFYACKNLKQVTLEEGIKEIGNSTFYNTAIESVFVPSSVEKIGRSTFNTPTLKTIEVSENNEYYCSIDGNLYSKDGKTLVFYATGKEEKEFIVPQTVAKILGTAFTSPYLEKVVLHDGIVELGDKIFYQCEALKEVVLSKSLKEISWLFTFGCVQLKFIEYPEGVETLGFGVLAGLDEVVIPLTIKTINDMNVKEGLNLYYKGTAETWAQVKKHSSLEKKLDTIHIYFYSEDEPEGEGNFWHYNSEGEIEVWE